MTELVREALEREAANRRALLGGNAWQLRYPDKLASAAQAVRAIQPGRRILIGSGAAEPTRLVAALVDHGEHLADNELVHLLTLGPAPYVRTEFAARFRHVAFFIGPNVREAVQEGRADFMPVFLSELPRLIQTRRVGVDVALIQVSPPDARGYVSLGVSVDIVRAAMALALFRACGRRLEDRLEGGVHRLLMHFD